MATLLDHPEALKRILLVDAATGIATIIMSVAAPGMVATLTGLPAGWIGIATALLVPAVLLMLAAAFTLAPRLVWAVIIGNVAWVVASLAVVATVPLTGLGVAMVIGQAAAVALLAALEFLALGRRAVAA